MSEYSRHSHSRLFDFHYCGHEVQGFAVHRTWSRFPDCSSLSLQVHKYAAIGPHISVWRALERNKYLRYLIWRLSVREINRTRDKQKASRRQGFHNGSIWDLTSLHGRSRINLIHLTLQKFLPYRGKISSDRCSLFSFRRQHVFLQLFISPQFFTSIATHHLGGRSTNQC